MARHVGVDSNASLAVRSVHRAPPLPRTAWSYGFAVLTVVVAAQAIVTHHSLSRIWYEELAESVRNVYWLADHRIYDGMSSNVAGMGCCSWCTAPSGST